MEILGVERRRRWSDAAKFGILSEIKTNGWTLADVARRHDLTRQQLYRWRHELRSNGLRSGATSDAFASVELTDSASMRGVPVVDAGVPEITITLPNGRQLRCREPVSELSLAQLLRMLEAS